MTTKINKDAAAVFLLLLVVALFFSPLLFDDKTLFFRDLTVLVYPMKYFTVKAYHEGSLPFWNPAIYSGKPFLAEMYPGVLYPLNLIFFSSDFTTAFNWFYVLHYVLLTLSVYALIRYWGLSVGAALCSAVTALLSGFFLSLPATTSLFYSAVWLPSIFYCAQRYLREGTLRHFTGAVFCLSCQILGGSPEFCVLTGVMLFFWSLTLAPEARWTFPRHGLPVAAMILLACGITAVQWVPTYFLMKESVRGNGLDFGIHAHWSMRPMDLISLLVPKNFVKFMEDSQIEAFSLFQSLYMGLFAVFFLCVGFLRLRHKVIRFWVCTFLLGIFFALGKYNPLYRSIYDWFPLIKPFRYPEKFYLLPAFSQVFLMGYGVDALVTPASANEPKPSAYVLIALALSLSIAGIALGIPWRNTTAALVFLAILILSCAMFFSGRWVAWGVKSILLALILIDLIFNNYMLLPMIDKKFYEKEPEIARAIKGDREYFRVYSGGLTGTLRKTDLPGNIFGNNLSIKERLIPDIGTLYGINYVDGIPGWSLESRDQWLWEEVFESSPPEKRLRILQRSNVKYWVRSEGVSEKETRILIPPKLEVFEEALPRAFMVSRFRVEKDPHLLNIYYDESFDPLREVLLSEPVADRFSDPASANERADSQQDFAGSVESIRYAQNQVVIQTRQSRAGFLVLLDTWFPGWTVTVDGVPDHIFRANHFYRAVQLGSGSHTVEFSFAPVGLRLGSWISIATLAGMVAVNLLWWTRYRRTGEG